MKIIILIIFALIFTNSFAWSDTNIKPQRITIKLEGSGPYQADQLVYVFQLIDTTSKKTLSDQDLIESHTKKLHFIAYDTALKEFNHVHPTFNGKIWSVTLNLPINGKYFFWVQGKLADQTEFSSKISALITGGKSENQVHPLGNVRSAVDDKTKVTIANTKIKAGKMTMLQMTISRTDEQEPIITPYLGAFAHVIATSRNDDQLNHVHPIEGSKPNTGMLHTTFPNAGDYRIWIQLMDHNILKTFPLSVIVLK